MTDQITLRYHITQTVLADGMIAAGNALAGNKRDWNFAIATTLAIALAATGGFALGSLTWISWMDRSGPALPWVLAGALGAFALFRYSFRRMAWTQAGMILNTRYGQAEQVMTIGPDGVNVENALARWDNTWGAVEKVLSVKSGLAVVISGIVLPVPNSAFGPDAPKDAVLDQMQTWLEATR